MEVVGVLRSNPENKIKLIEYFVCKAFGARNRNCDLIYPHALNENRLSLLVARVIYFLVVANDLCNCKPFLKK